MDINYLHYYQFSVTYACTVEEKILRLVNDLAVNGDLPVFKVDVYCLTARGNNSLYKVFVGIAFAVGSTEDYDVPLLGCIGQAGYQQYVFMRQSLLHRAAGYHRHSEEKGEYQKHKANGYYKAFYIIVQRFCDLFIGQRLLFCFLAVHLGSFLLFFRENYPGIPKERMG